MPSTDVIDISDSPIAKEDLQNVPQDEYTDFATEEREPDIQEMVSSVY